MAPLASMTIETVNRLLTTDEGVTVCYNPAPDPPSDGVFAPLPSNLHPELSDYLARQFPRGLFRHQRAALDYLLAGRNTVVATRTSSGKSLIYEIPVFDRLLTEPDSTALFLFPQKALANDQLQKFTAAADDVPSLARQRASNPHLLRALRRSHAEGQAPGNPGAGPGSADQSGHASLRRFGLPRQLGAVPIPAPVCGGRRMPRVPGHLRD